jgi:hypothetical protein
MRILNVTLEQGYHDDVVRFNIGRSKLYVLDSKQIAEALIASDQMCPDCEDTKEVTEDEYENGQLTGVGTIVKPCPTCSSKPIHEEV